MRFRIKKCQKCGRYTLKDICPVCGEKTKSAHPPKFSPEDPYGEYRRRLKRELFGVGVKK
ncbi:Ribosome biogenesis protein Nop10 [Thermococcus sp. 2319x1]|uniref:RNA-protein complex protein Nop10 n=1 Tax=Thermococcus sp. 2319x1 TaxID=1674923 RepID=UPI00073A8EF2|nr:RNA-protein complex protein Nop10 [Thermococcus sp. 2319x1]ALV62227.1 Ribosome biogenesis protein Nop10 [Thermococcus sp. 2319x1]